MNQGTNGGGPLFSQHAPDIGNGGAVWTLITDNGGTTNPTLAITSASGTNYAETQGSERQYSAVLTTPLAAGQMITEQINELQTGGNFFAGYSGFTLGVGNTAVAFLGHVTGTGSNYSLAASETASTNIVAATTAVTETQLATLTYVYNTGAATLTLTGAQGTVTVNGTLAAGQATATRFPSTTTAARGISRFAATATTPAMLVTISAVPEPTSIATLAIAALGLLGRRRRNSAAV